MPSERQQCRVIRTGRHDFWKREQLDMIIIDNNAFDAVDFLVCIDWITLKSFDLVCFEINID